MICDVFDLDDFLARCREAVTEPHPTLAIREVMDDHPPRAVATLDDVLGADAWSRERTRAALKRRAMETV